MSYQSNMPTQEPDREMAQLEGVIERIVFESDETGFVVARLSQPDQPGVTTVVGHLMALSPGETVRLWGEWVDDKRFGRQFKIKRYQTVLPATVDGIEKYLGSGLIEGIGKTFAQRLVNAFGVETLRVIDEEPERLRDVAGIGSKRARQIRQAWNKQRSIQSIMLFLQGHGIGVGQAVRIYKQYGDKAVAVLRTNPYRLIEDVPGIAFKGADKIAANLGIDKRSAERAEAGLIYRLDQAAASGHLYSPADELVRETGELLEVEAQIIEQALVNLVARRRVVREDDAIYPILLHQAEASVAERLKRLMTSPRVDAPIKTEKAITWVEKTGAIELSDEQRDAIRTAVESKVMVITGGPGTGKTTIINSLLAIFSKKGLNVVLGAPTGRAAKRMEEATEHSASTIHRLLEFSPKKGGFERDENNPLAVDLIIIDEFSMVDIQLMDSLLRAVPLHARLFIVGDVDQLPSVGPGNVLMDIIASEVVPVVWLRTIFRQAAQSGIITNAHRINRGEFPDFGSEDFFFVERKDPDKARDVIVDLVANRIPRKFGYDPVTDIQVLSPMHRGEAGVVRLNEVLQAELNPGGAEVPRRNFRVGDKVMQLHNNYELDVYNGDTGRITVADDEVKELQVQFVDRAVLYPYDELDNLALAYAATVHKSQGSEYPAVVIALMPQHYMLLQRNLVYTGVTRGKRLVVIVGDTKALQRAVANNKLSQRRSRLVDRLRDRLR